MCGKSGPLHRGMFAYLLPIDRTTDNSCLNPAAMTNILLSEEEEDGFVVVSVDCDGDIAASSSAPRPQLLDAIERVADEAGEAFWPVNKKIHDNPELGYKEYIAHDALTAFMRGRKGWKVTPSAYGYKTAWIAVFDSGKRGSVVSFNAEMGEIPYRSIRIVQIISNVRVRLSSGDRALLRPQSHCQCLGDWCRRGS